MTGLDAEVTRQTDVALKQRALLERLFALAEKSLERVCAESAAAAVRACATHGGATAGPANRSASCIPNGQIAQSERLGAEDMR